MIIDAHAHGFCRDHLDKLEGAGGDWAGEILGHLYKGKPHLFDVGLRLEMLDRNGIDLQVVTILDGPSKPCSRCAGLYSLGSWRNIQP